MSYPYFKRGLNSAGPSVRAEDIPTLDRSGGENPAGYIPHADLSHAVNVALVLGMPLLLTGEPGTGKTQLASALASEIGCTLHKFETKSSSQARDLFYTYDALSAFKVKDATDPRMFIRYQALGRAILEAFAPGDPRVQALLPPGGGQHSGPRRAVVLIDEIDKAPRDFPNDLLNEIDRLYFRVPELQNIGSPGADGDAGVDRKYRPIIVMTSNSEKGLPDPFLRRCVYLDIPFPTPQEMVAIVGARLEGVRSDSPLVVDALSLFYDLRRQNRRVTLKKDPTTAELLNWLQILLHRGVQPEQRLTAQKTLVLETLSTLIKNSEDRRTASDHIANTWGQ